MEPLAMVKGLPSFDYPPPAKEGYWSPVTSTINWCEEDYYATQYSAEIVNSLTNLLFIYLGIKGARSCIKHHHDTIFLVAFVGYSIVGTGSLLFHSTLKYPMQLVDELSMIYTTCLMCYATFSYAKSKTFRIWLAFSLVALSTFITLYYHWIQDPTFHQVTYAILTVVVLFRSIYTMEMHLRPSRPGYVLGQQKAGGTKAEKVAAGKRDDRILYEMWWMISIGLSVFLGGFALWNLDNAYCSRLRVWRREIGLPWGLLLEGHGWWHLMTGTGAYFYLTWGVWLRHCLNGKHEEYKLVWPRRFTSLPEIKRTSVPIPNGKSKKHQ